MLILERMMLKECKNRDIHGKLPDDIYRWRMETNGGNMREMMGDGCWR